MDTDKTGEWKKKEMKESGKNKDKEWSGGWETNSRRIEAKLTHCVRLQSKGNRMSHHGVQKTKMFQKSKEVKGFVETPKS